MQVQLITLTFQPKIWLIKEHSDNMFCMPYGQVYPASLIYGHKT